MAAQIATSHNISSRAAFMMIAVEYPEVNFQGQPLQIPQLFTSKLWLHGNFDILYSIAIAILKFYL